jgi:activator of 2-hydroxyglutaryl-CoA dehydratase
MIYIDSGTTYTKILKIENGVKNYSVTKSADFKKSDFSKITKCTGHNLFNIADIYENEVVALAYGAKKYLEDDFVVLDLGSRDIKYVQYQNKKFKDMNWNNSCASATGATVEMLLKFYDVKLDELKYTKEKYSITCGIFGLEKIMDDVAKGIDANIAISKFIHGLAYNAWNFAKNPDRICISGGFCDNPCFIESLREYCEVIPLGRFVLVDGLAEIK